MTSPQKRRKHRNKWNSVSHLTLLEADAAGLTDQLASIDSCQWPSFCKRHRISFDCFLPSNDPDRLAVR